MKMLRTDGRLSASRLEFARFFTRKIRMDIIATERRVDHPNVETKPWVSAIQPPISGAAIVAEPSGFGQDLCKMVVHSRR